MHGRLIWGLGRRNKGKKTLVPKKMIVFCCTVVFYCTITMAKVNRIVLIYSIAQMASVSASLTLIASLTSASAIAIISAGAIKAWGAISLFEVGSLPQFKNWSYLFILCIDRIGDKYFWRINFLAKGKTFQWRSALLGKLFLRRSK